MTELRKIRLLVSYDGSDFFGWQRQGREGGRTVQGCIEQALASMHKHPVDAYGSGRTDTGVHACGQVLHFHSDIKNIAVQNFVPALNSLLPQDVRVLRAELADPDFHARFSARSRLYRYFIIPNRPARPHELRYAWQIWRKMDLQHLNSLATCLKGEMDCRIFAGSRDKSHSTSRYIWVSRFVQEGNMLVYEIEANAFLYKMVRSIVGSLLHGEQQGLSKAEFSRRLANFDASLVGPTAPAKGLFLWHISYYEKG